MHVFTADKLALGFNVGTVTNPRLHSTCLPTQVSPMQIHYNCSAKTRGCTVLHNPFRIQKYNVMTVQLYCISQHSIPIQYSTTACMLYMSICTFTVHCILCCPVLYRTVQCTVCVQYVHVFTESKLELGFNVGNKPEAALHVPTNKGFRQCK